MSDQRSQIALKGKRTRQQRKANTEASPSTSTMSSTDVPSEQSSFAETMKEFFQAMETRMTNADRAPRNNLSLQNTIVPSFDPEDRKQSVIKWCERIDEMKNLYNWSDEATSFNAISKLDGLAKTWYQSLPTINFTWDQWKEELKKAFPPRRDFFENLMEMIRRTKRHDESYLTYYYEKVSLLNGCKLYGSDAVSCILGGIPDTTVKAAARASDYSSCEALLNFLKSCDTSEPGPSTYHETMPFMTNKIMEGRHLTNHTNFKAKSKITCYNCKREGHKSSECRVQKCYNCQRTGHRAADCRERPQPPKHEQENKERVL